MVYNIYKLNCFLVKLYLGRIKFVLIYCLYVYAEEEFIPPKKTETRNVSKRLHFDKFNIKITDNTTSSSEDDHTPTKRRKPPVEPRRSPRIKEIISPGPSARTITPGSSTTKSHSSFTATTAVQSSIKAKSPKSDSTSGSIHDASAASMLQGNYMVIVYSSLDNVKQSSGHIYNRIIQLSFDMYYSCNVNCIFVSVCDNIFKTSF